MRCFVLGLLLFFCGCAGRTEKIGSAVIDSVNGSEEVWNISHDDSLSGEDMQESKDPISGEEVWGIRLRVADVTPTGLTADLRAVRRESDRRVADRPYVLVGATR